MDQLIEYIKVFIQVLAILGITIEVVPIKFSPLGWIGKRLNSHLEKRLVTLEEKVDLMEKDREKNKLESKRTKVLAFASSCRNGERHTLEEFEHYINMIDEYDDYVEKNKIKNGVMKVQTKYIKRLYESILAQDECEEKRNTGGLLHYENDINKIED